VIAIHIGDDPPTLGPIHGQSVHEHDDRVLGDEWQHQPWRLPAGVQRDELGIDPRGAPTSTAK
jgi:hypothetical protein